MNGQNIDPRIRAALLCDYAITGQDGKVSAIGIFSNITFASLPANYPRFFVVIIASVDAGPHVARLQLVGPSSEDMIPEGPEMEISVADEQAETNLIIAFDNLPFQATGIHQLQLTLDGALALNLPFGVMSASDQTFSGRGNA